MNVNNLEAHATASSENTHLVTTREPTNNPVRPAQEKIAKRSRKGKSQAKSQEDIEEEEWRDIKLAAEISRLKKEGLKSTHDARKVATYDLRALMSE